ncbi:MAG TPA: ParB/RepB/Spo0J family partition protein [Thermoplasmata archaeon]|nr:ParB/RepB/Spo0J family partition protein [Thermoplasmata archaeon]
MTDVTRVLEIPIRELERNQNVREVRDADVRELAESIKEHGILEPVLVAKGGAEGGWTLISGYRRCAAAKLANLRTVPAIEILTDAKKQGFAVADARAIQLVENVQRQDLTPLEEARVLQELCDGGRTQKEVAAEIGKSQPYVANRIRLLKLPEKATQLLEKGTISPATAEQLLKLPEDATRELNSVVRRIGEQVKRDGQVDVRDLRWTLSSAQTSYRDRKEKERALARAKFPTCPGKDSVSGAPCGAKGHVASRYELDTLRCRFGHRWSAKSGKLEVQRSYDGDGRPQAAERPKPTLPEVDPIIAQAPGSGTIARRIVDAIQSIAYVSIHGDGGGLVEISLQARVNPELAKLPAFSTHSGSPKASEVTIDSIQSWNQMDDKGRKRCAEDRARLEAWFATFGRTKRPPPEPATAPAEVPA